MEEQWRCWIMGHIVMVMTPVLDSEVEFDLVMNHASGVISSISILHILL